MTRQRLVELIGVLAVAANTLVSNPIAQSGKPASPRGPRPNAITLPEALTIIEVAEKTASMLNICVGIGVVDARADVVAASRMTCGGSVSGGIGKAVTAAIFRQSSALVGQFATSQITRDMDEATGRRMNFLQGGVPVFRNGELIGAVGVSGGGASENDEEIAVAGINAVTF